MRDHRFPLLLVFLFGHRVGASDRRIDRPDQRWTSENGHLIDEPQHIIQPCLLLLRRAAQIAVRPHAGANGSANQAVPFQLSLYVAWIDMGGVLDRNLDRIEAPLLESFKMGGA